jgi:Ca2+-binding RTX toxin-like protein
MAFASSIDLSTLDGTNGFRIDGIDAGDISGRSVAGAGDVNGDGFDDIIIGAIYPGPSAAYYAGESYVVFGSGSGFAASFDLSSLNGTNGFRLDGIEGYDRSGYSVASAGDVNGDGFADIIIGAYGANPGGDSFAGESYVVFGSGSSFAASLNLTTLDGTNGFRLDGIDSSDSSGRSVASAGDVNGDGFDDLIIGADGANPGGDNNAGESYVIFGSGSGFAASLDLSTLDGTNGFRLDGIDEADRSGISVSSAGDVNGDGFDDVIIGASGADPGGDGYAGESYVVFGKASGFAASLDLSTLDGTNGFRLDGIDANDRSGFSVANAGDVNGDGFDDLIIGAFAADPGGDSIAGESYVVFGRACGFAASLDLSTLDGSNGFRLEGIDASDSSGISVSGAGDVNGDGYDDIIIGATGADSRAGETYVIFGRTSNQTEGTAGADSLTGADGNDVLNGYAGNDTLIGRKREDVLNGGDNDDRLYGGNGLDTLNGDGGNDRLFGMNDNDTLNGGAGDDRIVGGNGDDTITGGAGRDVLSGGAGSDTFVYTDALDSVAGATRDVINDFEHGVDKIDLSALDAIPGGDDDPFVIVSAFTGTAGEVRLFNNATGSSAAIDIDGDGVADMSIFIKSDAPLDASDFVL